MSNVRAYSSKPSRSRLWAERKANAGSDRRKNLGVAFPRFLWVNEFRNLDIWDGFLMNDILVRVRRSYRSLRIIFSFAIPGLHHGLCCTVGS